MVGGWRQDMAGRGYASSRWTGKIRKTFFVPLVLLLAALPLTLPAQKVSPGEVRVSSRPWRPTVHLKNTTTQVEIGTVVRNKKGKIVTGLKRQDFAVFDDGNKEELSGFVVLARQARNGAATQAGKKATNKAPTKTKTPTAKSGASPTPMRSRYVALYFDDLHMRPGDMGHVRAAAEDFIRTGLSKGDKVGLFSSSGSPQVDFTADASKVLQAVTDLRSHNRVFGGGSCPRMTPYDAYLISNNLDQQTFKDLWTEAIQCHCADVGDYAGGCAQEQKDAVQEKARALWDPILELSQTTLSSLRTVVNYLGSMPGKRVLVMASSGFFTETLRESINAIVDDALKAGVVINAIDGRGLFTTVPAHWRAQGPSKGMSAAAIIELRREYETFGPNVMMSRLAMIDFALDTGGRFFRDRNDITAGYYALAAAPRTEYLLTFAPEKLDGKYHKLKVDVTIPGDFSVQARPGYFATQPKAGGQANAQSLLDEAVLSKKNFSEFPSMATYQIRRSSSGELEMRVSFHVDLKKLPVVHRGGRAVEQIAFVAALFGPNGRFIVGKEGEMDLSLKPATYEQFSKEGIDASMVLPVQPGNYRLRTAAEEAVKRHIVARSQRVEVR